VSAVWNCPCLSGIYADISFPEQFISVSACPQAREGARRNDSYGHPVGDVRVAS